MLLHHFVMTFYCSREQRRNSNVKSGLIFVKHLSSVKAPHSTPSRGRAHKQSRQESTPPLPLPHSLACSHSGFGWTNRTPSKQDPPAGTGTDSRAGSILASVEQTETQASSICPSPQTRPLPLPLSLDHLLAHCTPSSLTTSSLASSIDLLLARLFTISWPGKLRVSLRETAIAPSLGCSRRLNS